MILSVKRKRIQFFKLVKEFGGKCVRCSLDEYHLDRDHIKPKCHGGSDHMNNIQPLCAWCNSSKGGSDRFKWKKFRRKYGWVSLDIKLAKTHPLKI